MLPDAARAITADDLSTIARFARWVSADPETVRRRIVVAGVQPVTERGREILYSIPALFTVWATPSEFVRRARVQADEIELRVRTKRGELVEALDVERTIGAQNQLFVRGLQTLLDVIERDCGLTPNQAAKMEQHIDGLLEDMHRQIVGGALDDEEPTAPAPVEAPATNSKPKAETSESAVQRSSGGSAVEEAIAFLREALAGGARSTAELVEACVARGLSQATLRRAKAQMGDEVQAKRSGRGWAWQLAQGAQPH